MTTSTALRPSVRAAFGELIDYAGLFPPAKLPLEQAKREYQAARCGAYAWMLGRFIIPAPLLITSTEAFEGPFSVTTDGTSAGLNAIFGLVEKGVKIEALEVRLGSEVEPGEMTDAIGDLHDAVVAADLGDRPAFVEMTRSERCSELLPGAMRALRSANFGAKLRCGGLTAEAFPSVKGVADFIAAAAAARVPFKATAGLHHPVRRLDAGSGFNMHGFLNILAAAAFEHRVDRDTLVRIVAEEDTDAFAFDDASFAWRSEVIGLTELAQTRREAFVAYGSCSFAEPVNDLLALALLPPQ